MARTAHPQLAETFELKFRISDDLTERLERWCSETGATRTAAARLLLTRAIDDLERRNYAPA